MARLPIVGSDESNWGSLLNEFLLESHRDNGTLKNVSTVINVVDWGALGDGVADDTDPIQKAIVAAHDGGGCTVYIPEGTYRITATIQHFSNVVVRGCGYSTVIRKSGGTPAWIFSEGMRAELSHLQIDGQEESEIGLQMSRSHFIHVHHVQLWDFDTGIVMSDGSSFSAYNTIGPEVEVNRCPIGVQADVHCNASTITGSRIFHSLDGGSGIGLDVADTGGLTVMGTTIEPADLCLRVRGQPICHFIGNYFEPGDFSRLTFDIDVPESVDGAAIVRGEGNVYNGYGIAKLPTSSAHYWDGNSQGAFGAFTNGASSPKRNLTRNGDLRIWGGFPHNVPNWAVLNSAVMAEETTDFITGTRSVRITQNAEGFDGLQLGFLLSDPGVRWVTVGCRYKVIQGSGFFIGASAGHPPRQLTDTELSGGSWQESHLQIPVLPSTNLGTVSLVVSTQGEVLIDEVWVVPGRFATESTQYGERIELLDAPIPILSRMDVISNEVQGPIDITNLPDMLVGPIAGLATAPLGVVGCLLRIHIQTDDGGGAMLTNPHYTYIDIPGTDLIPTQVQRVYSQWSQQVNDEMIIVRSTMISGGYQAGDGLPSDYEWQLIGWIMA
ncbi:MAG: glycosyl hydrolase family 28-related protein [Chloroflexota bacterium]